MAQQSAAVETDHGAFASLLAKVQLQPQREMLRNRITRSETNDKGEEEQREIPYLKGYTVFNTEQCDGLPSQFSALVEPPALTPLDRIAHADRFFANTGADIRHGGTKAYYSPSLDYVQMPPFETFRDAESHAATLAHELTHWTRHEKRLARDFGRVRSGDEGYAKEELVAELGSAFLAADLSITPEVREDQGAAKSQACLERIAAKPFQSGNLLSIRRRRPWLGSGGFSIKAFNLANCSA